MDEFLIDVLEDCELIDLDITIEDTQIDLTTDVDDSHVDLDLDEQDLNLNIIIDEGILQDESKAREYAKQAKESADLSKEFATRAENAAEKAEQHEKNIIEIIKEIQPFLDKILTDTTENWNRKASFVPDKGVIVIYEDKEITEDGKDLPGIKIGDGDAFLIDLPFITENIENILMKHINDSSIHISVADRQKWDTKMKTFVEHENLIFIY